MSEAFLWMATEEGGRLSRRRMRSSEGFSLALVGLLAEGVAFLQDPDVELELLLALVLAAMAVMMCGRRARSCGRPA